MRRLHRRALLKAVGALPFSLPLLPSLASAQTPSFPRRLLIFYHPNGTIPEAWWPTEVAGESRFELNRIHEPLAPFKQELLFLKGLDLLSPLSGPGEPHQRGMGGLLTGRHLLAGSFVGGDGQLAGWGSGLSVDQHIASRIGTDTKVGSLQLGVRASGAEVRTRLSYSGPAQPIPPQNDPVQVYQQLFAERVVDSPELARLRARRASVLTAVRGQFSSLTSRLSAEDRVRLAHHEALVADLEARLSLVSAGTGIESCAQPQEPPQQDADSPDTMPAIARLQLDLLVMALACDLTRVGSIQFSQAINAIPFPWVDSHLDGHSLSHLGASDPRREQIVARDRWVAEQFAYLLGRLRSIPEGEGTLLDHTLVLWCNELSEGNVHSQTDMPFLLAGRAGGVRPGRILQFERRSHNDLLVTLMNAMGVDEQTFGNPDYCSGPLPGVM